MKTDKLRALEAEFTRIPAGGLHIDCLGCLFARLSAKELEELCTWLVGVITPQPQLTAEEQTVLAEFRKKKQEQDERAAKFKRVRELSKEMKQLCEDLGAQSSELYKAITGGFEQKPEPKGCPDPNCEVCDTAYPARGEP